MTAEPAAPPPRSRIEHVPLGIVYMLGATVMFAVSNAVSKWQVGAYSFDEVLSFRAIASLAMAAVLIMPRTGMAVFHTRRLGSHAARGLAQTIAQSCLVVAFSLMPLGGAVAINFAAPLFATVLAAWWLNERIGLARGGALMVGFAGVLLVAAPGADSFRIGALFALANAVLYGSVTAAVRGMTSTESAETLTMYQMVFLAAFFALGLPLFGFVWPANADLVPLLVNGIINALGQYWWTRSLALAPPAAVGPFYYFSLVWALLLGFVYWHEVPAPLLLVGSAIVVGSGLFLLWHESGRKRRARRSLL
ncbi:MAG TPA: DMT family transporter, partial [Stellaceae bacterium]|nr:DMT family transporter [Stellaceae bacterium]